MENKRPEFAITEHSPLSLVTELHSYFRDMHSYYKIARGRLISELEASTDPDKTKDLSSQLEEVNNKLTFFHVLNNSISTVDTVLHTQAMIKELKEEK